MTVETRYRTVDVPVRGGELRVGIWDPQPQTDSAATIVAVHGVTASHRSWLKVAERLPEVRIVAPDLRGRGRSSGLPGPYGMGQHADDIAAVIESLGLGSVLVVGHSMGCFVTVALNSRHRDRVGAVVLVDGGLPFPPGPPGLTDDERATALLGPAKARLSMTFPDRESYQNFFRAHPAFADEWNDAVADYVDYDLVGEAPALRASTPVSALAEDAVDMAGDWVQSALQQLPPGTPLLRAQRGLLGAEPGMYPPEWAATWQQRLPGIVIRDVLGVNHYTILLGDSGADTVADTVRQVAGRSTPTVTD